MPVRLTDAAIAKAAKDAAAAGARRDLADAACPGLRLRLTPAGGKGWVLACRDRESRMRRFPLGAYPAMGVSEARTAARTLHGQVKHEGADPVAERRKERAAGQAARDGIGTLAALLDLYGAKVGAAQRAWAPSRKRIESVFAEHLDRPLTTLRLGTLQMAADGWRSPASAAAAVRFLRPVLKWAAARKYAGADLAGIVPPARVKQRQRVLTREELAALLPVLAQSSRPYSAAMRFLLLTLARREEAGEARWQDVDFQAGTWTIPKTKNGQPHIVPLSRQAVALLTGLQAALPPIQPGDKAAVLARKAARVFGTPSGGALLNWDRETKAIMQASGTDGWTRHDLRRTGATMLGDMGEMPDIIEAALNHVAIRSALAATYNRSRYRPQVAAALQRLGDALEGIEHGGAVVVPMRAG